MFLSKVSLENFKTIIATKQHINRDPETSDLLMQNKNISQTNRGNRISAESSFTPNSHKIKSFWPLKFIHMQRR